MPGGRYSHRARPADDPGQLEDPVVFLDGLEEKTEGDPINWLLALSLFGVSTARRVERRKTRR